MTEGEKTLQRLRDLQHFGEEGGVVPVIDVAATSTFMNPDDMERAFKGELQGCYLYSRHSNPSVSAFSKKMAALENAEAAIGVASGMAAVSCAVEQLIPGRGHIVSSRTVYGGTYALFANVLPQRGIDVTFVDPRDLNAVKAAVRKDTKVLYTEGLSNPLLAVSDIAGWSAIAKSVGAKTVVDNTFSPLLLQPLKLGADVVIHSCTKFLSGSADLIAGCIVSSQDFINQLIDVNSGQVMIKGPVMDARIAHELYLRLDHFPVRFRAHGVAAMTFAKRLSEAGIKVFYPGLETHPDFALLTRQGSPEFGFGGMVTVDCGTRDRALRLAEALQTTKFGLYAVSLGFSRTLISVPSLSTSSEVPEAEQEAMGLRPSLLRLSLGYTGSLDVMLERFMTAWRTIQ